MKRPLLLLPLLALALPALAQDPATTALETKTAKVSVVSEEGLFPGRFAIAETNGWSTIGKVIGDRFGGSEWITLETRAFSDGVLVAQSIRERRADETNLRCEERFLRWEALPSSVSFGAATVRVERVQMVNDQIPLPRGPSFLLWEDRFRTAPATNAPILRATARFVEAPVGRKDKAIPLSADWSELQAGCYEHPTHAHADIYIGARAVAGAVEVMRSSTPLPGDGRVLEMLVRTIFSNAIPADIKLPEGTVQIR